MKTTLLAFAFTCLSGLALAQTGPETSPDSVAPASKRLTVYPVAFYTPETQIGVGIKPIYVRKSEGHRPTDRPMLFSPMAVYTTRKQILTSFTADVWRKHNAEHLYGLVEYNDYPYFFFGIGNDSPDHAEEAYTSRTVNVIAQYEHQVFRKVYLGGRYEFKHETIPKVEAGRQLAGKTILGSEGTRSSGLGPVFMVDSRDNVFTPSRGSFHQFSALFFHKFLGSETNFNRYKLDLRNYRRLGPGVFAVQGLFSFVTGDAPFQFLSPLGGVYVMRGLLEGRFRDEDAAVVQADYRFPLFWRIGGAVFGGAGQVSQRIPDFRLNKFHLTGGTGLRYKLNNEGMVVRGDVAFSDQGMYLYFAFSEAF
ncbi:BamA/TamA family outer membrane protein [Rufibacter psychrotolerans]|uniref:BamA/TamA family outer membrane protein n=1 Tax=Rufibacter psychrotolerans TaxID=2812556 RepID=UPI0019675FCE|nr:BamA/TamA family outer membrane protein [Rufibacter sp. SYSU D00308]